MSNVETPAEPSEEKVEENKAQENSDEQENVTELKNKNNKENKKKEKKEEVKDDFKEKYYYLAAEFENTRKRFNREKENLIKYGNEKVISSLLEVVDNLERTMDALADDKEEKIVNIVSGVAMVQKQFLDVLKQQGLEQIDALGKPFDPNFHEAMSQQAAEGKEDGEIIMEYQKGYMLNGRLLRATKVIVVKN